MLLSQLLCVILHLSHLEALWNANTDGTCSSASQPGYSFDRSSVDLRVCKLTNAIMDYVVKTNPF